jgi:hypothetical protein
MSRSIFHSGMLWILCLFCALCCIIITACDTAGKQGQASPPTAPSGTKTSGSTPTVHSTPSPSPSSPTTCGTITIHQGTTQGMNPMSAQQPDPQQITQCFWSAFQQCHPATLRFVMIGTATEATRVFTIEQSTQHCSVSDTVQKGTSSQPASTTNVYPCTSVANSDTALYISSCGADGSIIIPTRQNMQPQQKGGPIMVPAGHV